MSIVLIDTAPYSRVTMARYDEKHRKKLREGQLGSNNSNWKGGISPEYYRLKGSSAWRALRKRIYDRDKGICSICKMFKEKWHIHHLIHWDKAKELIFVDTNVITLCSKCHHRTHRLGLRVGEYEKRMNSRETYVHPRWKTLKILAEYGNLEPSRVETRKVQRLPEDGTPSLITGKSVLAVEGNK